MYSLEESLNTIVLSKGLGSLGLKEMKELLAKLKGKVHYLTIQNFCKSHEEKRIKIDKRIKNLNIEVSPDLMAAYVTFIEKPSAEDILEELDREGIKTVLDIETIRAQLQGTENRILVAQGIPPGKAEDERIEWYVRLPETRSSVAAKENVDYYKLDIFSYVSKGEKICKIIPPVTGKTGQTIYGEKIIAPSPKRISYHFSNDFEKNEQTIFAKKDGVLEMKNMYLGLAPVLKITGDVDYKTGNINSNVNVFIGGWLRTGFSVISEKNVFIEGGVEEKTTVKTGEDLSVVLGIMGNKKTKIECEGDLKAKFIQDTTVIVKKNIYINEYIMNSDVVCQGSVYVNGSKGSIINTNLDAKVSVELKRYKMSQQNRGIKVKGFQRGMYLRTLKDLHAREKELKEKLIYLSVQLRGISKNKKDQLQYTLGYYQKCQQELAEIKEVIEDINTLLKKVQGEGMVKILSVTDQIALKIKGKEVKMTDSKPITLYYDPEKKGIVKECLAKN